jgi:phage gp46-like protein
VADDIKILWDNDFQEGDIKYLGGDLVRELGIETAVMMSLYTDRRANTDDTLPDSLSEDRRGWWGDQVTEFDGDQIGSRLWLLERAKTTEDNLSDAKFYIEESLQWLLDDGVAQDIEVEVERQNREDGTATLAALIKILQTDGGVTAIKYDDLWRSI